MFDFYWVFATRAVDKCHLLADESVKAFAVEVVCIGSVVLEFSGCQLHERQRHGLFVFRLWGGQFDGLQTCRV